MTPHRIYPSSRGHRAGRQTGTAWFSVDESTHESPPPIPSCLSLPVVILACLLITKGYSATSLSCKSVHRECVPTSQLCPFYLCASSHARGLPVGYTPPAGISFPSWILPPLTPSPAFVVRASRSVCAFLRLALLSLASFPSVPCEHLSPSTICFLTKTGTGS